MKVRCINIEGTLLLKLGEVYEAAIGSMDYYIILDAPNYGCAFDKSHFKSTGDESIEKE